MTSTKAKIRLGWATFASFVLLLISSSGEAAQPAQELARDNADATGWRAGIARATITPEVGLWMAGYGARDRPAEGTLQDLWAKVLVLEDQDGEQAVLVTFDLVGMERDWTATIMATLEEQYGLSRAQIAVNASHTHTGPVVGQNLRPMHYLLLPPEQQQLIDQYSSRVQETIVELVGEALQDLQPASLTWGSGEATFAVNRRNNRPESEVPAARRTGSLVGPVDHAVPVLAISDARDELRCVVFGYACHATVLSFYQWSGDYPGFAQAELEERFPGTQAMFWAGCGGDQNPLPRRSVELAQHYGQRLANSVAAVLYTEQLLPLAPQLQVKYREIDLPLASPPPLSHWQEQAQSRNRYVAARARAFVRRLEAGEQLPTEYPYPIQRWQLGEQIDWLFLGGEVVVEYALKLKTQRAGERTWVAAYSNDVMAYIPSRRVWSEGGYEGADAMIYYGLPNRWSATVEDDILQAIEKQLPDTTHETNSR